MVQARGIRRGSGAAARRKHLTKKPHLAANKGAKAKGQIRADLRWIDRTETGTLWLMTYPAESAPEPVHRTRRIARWMLAALAIATVATIAVVWWYPYPDLQDGYATTGALLMTASSIGFFVLMRRERKREVERRSMYQAIIWTSAFFLVFVAPSCIGTLTASAP